MIPAAELIAREAAFFDNGKTYPRGMHAVGAVSLCANCLHVITLTADEGWLHESGLNQCHACTACNECGEVVDYSYRGDSWEHSGVPAFIPEEEPVPGHAPVPGEPEVARRSARAGLSVATLPLLNNL